MPSTTVPCADRSSSGHCWARMSARAEQNLLVADRCCRRRRCAGRSSTLCRSPSPSQSRLSRRAALASLVAVTPPRLPRLPSLLSGAVVRWVTESRCAAPPPRRRASSRPPAPPSRRASPPPSPRCLPRRRRAASRWRVVVVLCLSRRRVRRPALVRKCLSSSEAQCGWIHHALGERGTEFVDAGASRGRVRGTAVRAIVTR